MPGPNSRGEARRITPIIALRIPWTRTCPDQTAVLQVLARQLLDQLGADGGCVQNIVFFRRQFVQRSPHSTDLLNGFSERVRVTLRFFSQSDTLSGKPFDLSPTISAVSGLDGPQRRITPISGRCKRQPDILGNAARCFQ